MYHRTFVWFLGAGLMAGAVFAAEPQGLPGENPNPIHLVRRPVEPLSAMATDPVEPDRRNGRLCRPPRFSGLSSGKRLRQFIPIAASRLGVASAGGSRVPSRGCFLSSHSLPNSKFWEDAR
jgi:hypothetical protein